MAAACLAARRVLGDAVRGIGRPGAASAAAIISTALLLPCLYLLVPRLGLGGVALSFAVSAALGLCCLIALVMAQPKRLRPFWESFPGDGETALISAKRKG